VLDDLLTLFRRRRAPVRRRKPAVDSRWRINLATMGGLIGLGRPDRIPRTGPAMRPRRPYQETDDWQPAPSYAQPAAPYAQPQPDENADWQAAQYAQHAEPRAPQRVRQGDGASRHEWQQPNQQPIEQRHYLAAHAVEKTFGDRKVVKGASLYVRRGEAVGLLGPNGAGKTTIFYMMTGLISADKGRVELDGHDVTTLPMYQRARLGIGYLPQEASIFRACWGRGAPISGRASAGWTDVHCKRATSCRSVRHNAKPSGASTSVPNLPTWRSPGPMHLKTAFFACASCGPGSTICFPMTCRQFSGPRPGRSASRAIGEDIVCLAPN